MNSQQDQIIYDKVKKLLFRVLSLKPEDRPSINEVLGSEFFGTIWIIYVYLFENLKLKNEIWIFIFGDYFFLFDKLFFKNILLILK